MSAKNSEKFQPLGHFFELAHGKKLRFLWFGRKIKINRDLVGIQWNFIDTSIKIHIEDVQSFVTFWISLDFFFNCDFARFGQKNKKNWDLFGILQNFAHPLYVFL